PRRGKKGYVRENLGGRVQNYQHVFRTQVMKCDPLLQYSVLSQMLSAEFIEFLVIKIGLTADPKRGELNRNHVVSILRQKQKVTAIGNRETYTWVAVKHPIIHSLEPLPCGVWDLRSQLGHVDLLEWKTCNGTKRTSSSQPYYQCSIELVGEKSRDRREPSLRSDLSAVIALKFTVREKGSQISILDN